MKGMIKILIRYVISAAGIAIVLLLLNIGIFIAWTAQSINQTRANPNASNVYEIANAITKKDNTYMFSENGKKVLKQKYEWAMLLNKSGTVIWSQNLPHDVPLSYTVSQVASFSRWYLNDYPVYVWNHKYGLLVVGCPKNSLWKLSVQIPEKIAANITAWFTAILILNGIVAILLALLCGLRLFRSLKPLAHGIENMAQNQNISLPTNGLLGDLSLKLNQTSSKLKKQETDLKKRDDARTMWIANVSHDIRTPLSLVMGYASELESSSELPPKQREQAHIIRMQSEKIKNLVNDLNLASKLQYDMQPLRLTSIYPAALIRSVIADFFNSGLKDNYFIDADIKADAQSIILTGDEELLKRAVSNLISNSIKHNPDGCSITVTAEKEFPFCKITISDNGIGFPMEILKGLKNPEDPPVLENHGLGLNIVRQIIKVHGGTSEFNNRTQGGCEVIMKLLITTSSDNKG